MNLRSLQNAIMATRGGTRSPMTAFNRPTAAPAAAASLLGGGGPGAPAAPAVGGAIGAPLAGGGMGNIGKLMNPSGGDFASLLAGLMKGNPSGAPSPMPQASSMGIGAPLAGMGGMPMPNAAPQIPGGPGRAAGFLQQALGQKPEFQPPMPQGGIAGLGQFLK